MISRSSKRYWLNARDPGGREVVCAVNGPVKSRDKVTGINPNGGISVFGRSARSHSRGVGQGVLTGREITTGSVMFLPFGCIWHEDAPLVPFVHFFTQESSVS